MQAYTRLYKIAYDRYSTFQISEPHRPGDLFAGVTISWPISFFLSHFVAGGESLKLKRVQLNSKRTVGTSWMY